MIPDLLKALIQRDRSEFGTAIKCIFINRLHAGRDRDRGQTALGECSAADRCDRIRDCKGSNRFHAGEQSICNLLGTFSQADFGQGRFLKRCIRVGQRRRDADLREREFIECMVADRFKAFAQRDGGQIRASLKCALTDRRDTCRNGYGFELLIRLECACFDSGNRCAVIGIRNDQILSSTGILRDRCFSAGDRKLKAVFCTFLHSNSLNRDRICSEFHIDSIRSFRLCQRQSLERKRHSGEHNERTHHAGSCLFAALSAKTIGILH